MAGRSEIGNKEKGELVKSTDNKTISTYLTTNYVTAIFVKSFFLFNRHTLENLNLRKNGDTYEKVIEMRRFLEVWVILYDGIISSCSCQGLACRDRACRYSGSKVVDDV